MTRSMLLMMLLIGLGAHGVARAQATAWPAEARVGLVTGPHAGTPGMALRPMAGAGLVRDTTWSPIDTLRMSPWERIFWSRGGLMRRTGLFPLDADRPVNDLRQVVQVRRRMLSLHQVLGLATVGVMGATVVAGQIAYNGNGSGLHKALIPITTGMYGATAALALLSPPKLLSRGGGWDTVKVHRWLAVLHVAGMILTPMLAPDDGEGNRSLHRTLGYATFATFSTAMLVVTLFR